MRPLCLALAGWFVGAGLLHAQDASMPVIPFHGAEVFCHVLFHEGLEPSGPDGLDRAPRDTVLILFGNLGQTGDIDSAAFVKNGGNLLVVTDYPFATALGVEFSGGLFVQREGAYRQTPECPWLASADGGKHLLFANLHRGIAANRPSTAIITQGAIGIEPILAFPAHQPASKHGEKKREAIFGPPPRYYMVGSPGHAPPVGRMLFIAGQGMFMNGMMLQTDNDNFDFAVNAIRWLRQGPGASQRSHAMLVVDGKVVRDFNMNLSPRPTPPRIPVPPVHVVNRLVRGMEEERLFHKMLYGILGDNLGRTIGVLIAIVTFGVLFYGAKRFLEERFHLETGVPRMVGTAPPLPSRMKRRPERQKALHAQRDCAEESCALTRYWLQCEFGILAADWPAQAAVRLQASGGFWSRFGLQRRADEVIRIVRAGGSAPMSRRQFARLLATLTALSEAHGSGRLALLVDGKNVRQQ